MRPTTLTTCRTSSRSSSDVEQGDQPFIIQPTSSYIRLWPHNSLRTSDGEQRTRTFPTGLCSPPRQSSERPSSELGEATVTSTTPQKATDHSFGNTLQFPELSRFSCNK